MWLLILAGIIENVYIYADDNVLSYSGDSLQEVAASLQTALARL